MEIVEREEVRGKKIKKLGGRQWRKEVGEKKVEGKGKRDR
jgi:hypothetical protein